MVETVDKFEGKPTVIVIGTNGSWGRGFTITEAMKNAFRPKAYILYFAPPNTKVNPVDGGLSWPQDSSFEPTEIERKGIGERQ